MWPFSSLYSSSGDSNPTSPQLLPPSPSLEAPQGPDGVAQDVPVIAYTEQVIAEKEASLRKYIQDNYAKLHAVEKELEALRFEVKLTSGSKKAALEHLRQKIEESSERIRMAQAKEQQAKEAWELAAQALKDEEDYKQRLCDDLRLMIQESALLQFERLESLTKKLDALNPELKGAAMSAIEGLRAQIAPHGAPILLNGGSANDAAPQETPETETNKSSADAEVNAAAEQQSSAAPAPPSASGTGAEALASDGGAVTAGSGTERGSPGPGAGKGGGVQLKGRVSRPRGGLAAQKGQQQQRQASGGWTGAGFEVDALS